MFKIIIFVPVADAEKLRKVMGDAGAGVLGKYRHASFSTKGVGRFIPSEGAHPTIGMVGKMSEVEEERIEVEKRHNIRNRIIAECNYFGKPVPSKELMRIMIEDEINNINIGDTLG